MVFEIRLMFGQRGGMSLVRVCADIYCKTDAAFAALNVTFSYSDNCTFAASSIHFTVASAALLFAAAELSPKVKQQQQNCGETHLVAGDNYNKTQNTDLHICGRALCRCRYFQLQLSTCDRQ